MFLFRPNTFRTSQILEEKLQLVDYRQMFLERAINIGNYTKFAEDIDYY